MNDQTIQTKPERFLRMEEVTRLVGLGKTTIYAGIKADPPTFPAPFRLGPKAVAWRESDIARWQRERERVHT